MNLNDIEKEIKCLEQKFPLLFSQKHNSPFIVPHYYFSENESNLILITRLNELKGRIFEVPDKYFADNSLNIKSALISNNKKVSPFSVDEAYFSQSLIQLEINLKLDTIKDQSVFSMPEKYFESKEEFLKSTFRTDKSPELNYTFQWANLIAIAACLASVCLISFYFLSIKKNENIQLSKLQIEQIKDSPGDFGLDDSMLADLLENDSENATEGRNLDDALINQVLQDPSVDVNALIDIE